jgi:hypothetical protein
MLPNVHVCKVVAQRVALPARRGLTPFVGSWKGSPAQQTRPEQRPYDGGDQHA